MQTEGSRKVGLRVEMKVTRGSKVSAPNPDMNWIVSNYNRLRTEYPDKWIAVKEKKVVDSDLDLEPLLQRLKEKHGTAVGFATEFIGAKPRNMII